MSIIYNSNPVLEGLKINIDAANLKSYPGSGTTIYDISGNNKNATVSGPSFDSTSKSFIFDGINDLILFGSSSNIFPLPQISLEVLFRSTGTVPTTGTSPALFGFTYGVRLFVYSNYIQFTLHDGGTFISVNTPTYNYQDSQWHHLVCTNNGLTSTIYVDGVYKNSTTCLWKGFTIWTMGCDLGRDQNNSMYYFSGNIGLFRLYGKALSSSEVIQNFNSIRGRYNI